MSFIKQVRTPDDVENNWINVYHQYLRDRDFDPIEMPKQTGISLVTGTDMARELGYKEGSCRGKYAIRIPYPGTDYVTFRVLNPGPHGSKVYAPKGEAPRCYTPQDLDWEEFDGKLYICESVLKALSLSQRGYYAIAGSGVDGIYNRHGFAVGFPHHVMEKLDKAVVLFDSDIRGNDGVIGASQRLAAGIINSYPNSPLVLKKLPPPYDLFPEDHWGIDDAIHCLGLDWLRGWMEGGEDESPLDLEGRSKHFTEINALYAFVEKPAGIVELATGNHWTPSEWFHVEGDRIYVDHEDKPKEAARAWMKWAGRNRCKSMEYVPAGDELCGEYYNTWKDDGVVAEPGDVVLFTDYLYNMMPEPGIADLFLDCLGWMLQNRGSKLEKNFMLMSPELGTGKSTVNRIISAIYGPSNTAPVGASVLSGRFTSFFAGKEVILVDEVQQMDEDTHARIDRFTTDPTVDMEAKGKDARAVTNYSVIFMNSNRAKCLPLKGNDRRAVVAGCTPTEVWPQGDVRWDRLNEWLIDLGGYGAIRWWLEARDLSAFNPRFMPPLTPTKLHMIQSSKTDEEAWCLMVRADIGMLAELGVPDGRLYFAAEELAKLMAGHNYEDNPARLIGAAKKLGRHGLADNFRQVCAGRQIRVRLAKDCKVKKGRAVWNIRGKAGVESTEVQENFDKYPIEYQFDGLWRGDGLDL